MQGACEMSKGSKFDFLANSRQTENESSQNELSKKENQRSRISGTQKSENSEPQKSKSLDVQDITTSALSHQGQPAKRRGRPPGKRSNPDYEQVTAYIRSGTYLSVKKTLLDDPKSRDFSTLLEELLVRWLNDEK